MNEKKAYLASDVILRFFVKEGTEVDKIIEFAKAGKVHLITSDFALYEAISSLKDEEINRKRLEMFLYIVDIIPSPKIKIIRERIEHLRRIALRGSS